MKELYNAGSMFNEAQQFARKREGLKLRKAFPDMIISNPVDFDTNQGVGPAPKEIWDVDYQRVKESEYLIFELDSLDDGTIMEFALAMEMAKTTQPKKFLVPVISDFRYTQKHSTKFLPEFGINHFVYGALFDEQLNVEHRIYLAKSHQDAITMITNREAFLKTGDEHYQELNDELDLKNLYSRESLFN